MKYQQVIFDFDGTLADSFPWFLENINQVAAKYGFRQVTENEIATVRKLESKKILAYLEVPIWKLPMIGNHLRTLMAKDVARISLFAGIDRLLQAVSRNRQTIAIVSSNSLENIQFVLGPELAALIQYYECGTSMFGKSKKLRKILARSRIASDKTIFIGDETRDILAAQEAGIASGAASWGYAELESLKMCAPTEIFSSIEELITKLTEH